MNDSSVNGNVNSNVNGKNDETSTLIVNENVNENVNNISSIPSINDVNIPIETPTFNENLEQTNASLNVTPQFQNTINETTMIQSSNNDTNGSTVESKTNTQEDIETKTINKIKVKKQHGFLKGFFGFIIVLIFFAWLFIVACDFYNISNKKDALFCIKSGKIKNSDGEVSWCLGAGYKTYIYSYGEYEAYEFGPMWNEAKSLEEIMNK